MSNRDDEHDREHGSRFRLRGKRAGGGQEMPRPEPPHGDGGAPGSETESALVQRLRNMEWPAPPEGVRERCLDQLLGYMDSLKEGAEGLDGSEPMGRLDAVSGADDPDANPPHGCEQRHNLTRRLEPSRRSPISFSERPVRVATVL